MNEQLTVTDLIDRAESHLEKYGDTPVNVVLWEGHPGLNIEPAMSTDVEKYDKDGPWFFEVEGA